MRVAFAFLMLLLVASANQAQQEKTNEVQSSITGGSDPKCNCTITPYLPAPPCPDICCASILDKSTLEELQLIIGVKKETAEKIMNWKKNNKLESLKNLEGVISNDEIKVIKSKINSLTEVQLQYFSKPPEIRANLNEELKEVFATGMVKP